MQRVAISLPALAVKDDANVAAGVHADEASLDLPAITIPSVLDTIIAGRKNITVLKTFRTQDEAFAYSDAGARLPLFARDLDARPDFSKAIAQGTSKKPDSRRGQKEYTRASYGRMLSYTRAMRPDQRRWYEILLANMWCNLFLDLDLCKTANPHLTTEACATMLTDIEAHLRAFIHENFPWLRSESPPDDANEGIRIVKLASSSAKKFSVHLVVHIRGVAFRDYRDCGAFIRRFSRYLVEKEGAPEANRFFAWGEKTDLANLPTPSELGVLLRNEDYDARKNWKSFVDLKIYTIHRAFRCPGSHKEGDDMQTRKLWLLDELEMRIKTDWMSEAGAHIDDALFYDSMIQYFDPDRMPTNLIACTEWDGSEPTGSSNAWSHLYDRSQINYLGKRSSSMSS